MIENLGAAKVKISLLYYYIDFQTLKGLFYLMDNNDNFWIKNKEY